MKNSRDISGLTEGVRGFKFMALNHDGVSPNCADDAMVEMFPGVYITLDSSTGLALIEVNPSEKIVRLEVNGQPILDVAQLSRQDVLSYNGADYVFLKYMDVYFNEKKPRNELVVTTAKAAKVVRLVQEKQEKERFALIEIVITRLQAAPLKLKVLYGLTFSIALLTILVFFGSTRENILPESAIVSDQSTAVKKTGPSTLLGLMDEPLPATAAEVRAQVPEKKTAVISPMSPIPAAVQKTRTASTKPKLKQAANKVVVQKVSPSALHSMEKEFQEAVLIKGYDSERSVRILRALRKQVPAGSKLQQKIDKELRGR